jgi:ATP-binding cassette, subfamily G (WHITE), member 2, PDR
MYKNAEWTDTVNERSGLMFLLIWIFYMFTSTFTMMIIAGIETAELGGNLANLMFMLTLIFCGYVFKYIMLSYHMLIFSCSVLAQPGTFPHFWIFMYRVSPFTYLVSAMLSTGLANAPVVCKEIEFVSFEPPSNQTCAQYMADYISVAGGYLRDPSATSDCAFCSASETNAILNQLGLEYDERWRNFGLMVVYTIFNLFAALALYWLLRVPKGQRTKEMKAGEEPVRQMTRPSMQDRRGSEAQHHHELQEVHSSLKKRTFNDGKEL